MVQIDKFGDYYFFSLPSSRIWFVENERIVIARYQLAKKKKKKAGVETKIN